MASIMPVSMGEWRSSRSDSDLSISDGRMNYQFEGIGNSFYFPLVMDLDPKRCRKPLTWRQLTVAEKLEKVPSSVASAFRVHVGNQQWIIYRSLATTSNRTFLGQNLNVEFFVGTLEEDGTSSRNNKCELIPINWLAVTWWNLMLDRLQNSIGFRTQGDSMNFPTEQLAQNYQRVLNRIESAAVEAGRDPEDVQLVAVTKYVETGVVRSLYELGCRHFGESRPQALWEKADSLRDLDISWHMIGHLQTNKVRRTLPLLSLVHSGDSMKLLTAVDEESRKSDRVSDILCEVNIFRGRNQAWVHGRAIVRVD